MRNKLTVVHREPGADWRQGPPPQNVGVARKPVAKASDEEIVRRFRDHGVSIATLGHYHPDKRLGAEAVIRRALQGTLHVPMKLAA